MRITKILFIFILLLNGALRITYAQQGFYITHYNAYNSLGQNIINDLEFDYDGYMWLATTNGLIRYDGRNFYNFNQSVTENFDKKNIVSIFHIPAEKGTFVKNRFGDIYKIENGSPVSFIKSDTNRRNFLNIYGYYPSERILQKFNYADAMLSMKLNWFPHATRLVTLNQTDFLVLGGTRGDSIFYYRDINKIKASKLPESLLSFITISNNIYYAGETGRLYLYNPANGTSSKSHFTLEGKGEVSADMIKNMFFFRDEYSNKVFCNYINAVYEAIEPEKGNGIIFRPVIANLAVDGAIQDVCYNSYNNSYYISTLSNGIYIYKRQDFQTIETKAFAKTALERRDFSSTNILYSIARTGPNTAITASGFEIKETGDSITMQKIHTLYGNRETIAINGDSIISAEKSDIFYNLKSENYSIRHPYISIAENNINYGTDIYLLQQQGDSLWFVSPRLFGYIKNNRLNIIYKFSEAKNELETNQAFLFINYNNRDLWLSNFNGLFVFHKTNSGVSVDTIHEMQHKRVRGITPYKDLSFYAVYHDGLYIYKNKVFYKVPLEERFSNIQMLHSVYIDSAGFMWTPTDHGMYKARVSDVLESVFDHGPPPFFYYHGREDGIDNPEFNGGGTPQYAALQSGRLLYPSMGGVVTFNPARVTDIFPNHSAFIFDAEVNGKPITLSSYDSIRLSRNVAQIKLILSTPYFADNKNLVIQYKLDSSNWTYAEQVQGNHDINLFNLSAGWHRLTIRKRTGFGKDDFVYSTIAIYKAPGIQEMWWYIPAICLLILALILFAVILYNRNLQRKRKQLQRLVDIQTSELKENIAVKEIIISIILHDMVTPLKYVSLMSSILKKGIEKNPVRVNSALSDIKQTADKILTGFLGIINWMKYSSDKVVVVKEEINIYYIVQDIIDLFAPLAAEKNVQIVSSIPAGTTMVTDKDIFPVIVNNIVSNAVKNTDKGSVDISFNAIDAQQTITIKDTGKGMNEEELAHANEILTGNFIKTGDNSKLNTSLGFYTVGKLASLLHCHIDIKSIENEGTEVNIVFS